MITKTILGKFDERFANPLARFSIEHVIILHTHAQGKSPSYAKSSTNRIEDYQGNAFAP